ncbi:MAG: phosphate/phosphite/phosphonate ABC transporter substrate-binding protein [Bdellovibrionales bacterium]|nr:phosphate/phosphite/phosphonate ABC transporter substrate-binding protein [Bdellovibrionales bacterium]
MKKTNLVARGLFVVSLISIVSLLGCKSENSRVGDKDAPLKMFFVPSDDTHTIATGADQIKAYLEKFVSQRLYQKDEGFYINASVPMSYIAVVEAFGTKRADFAAINTFSYVLLKDIKKYNAEAVLNVIRGKDETSYKAQFIARADSGINSIEDLNGKKFAYSDPASTSGYVLPSMMIKEKGIKLKDHIFAGRHDNVVTMVYQGQVDAGATYFSPKNEAGEIMDARRRVKTQFPDVEDKIKIIGFSQEIPNAPWVLRTDLFKDQSHYEKVKSALQDGLIEYAKTEEGKKVLMELYSITGLVKASDAEFDGIRKMFSSSDLDVEKLLRK